jgi:hypothetical protein
MVRFQRITYNFSECSIRTTFIYGYFIGIGTTLVIVTVLRTDSFN